MARTRRKDGKSGRKLRDGEVHSLFYRRENGEARKFSRHKYRKAVKQAIRDGKEEVPTFKGTCGWLSN